MRNKLVWIYPVLCALLSVLPFLPVLHAQFVNWDDVHNFVNNPFYRGLGPAQLKWMFTNTAGHYIPLTWMTLGLDYVIWGMNPSGYHLTNLVLHVANACLLYYFSLQLYRLSFPDLSPVAARWMPVSALLAALLFSIHPLRVESVAWVTERRDVLCGFFLFSSLITYLRAVQEKPNSHRYTQWLAGSLVLFLLSLFSKASAMTLSVVLLLLDIYPLRRIGGERGWTGSEVLPVWREKFLFAIAAVPAMWMAHASESDFTGMVGQQLYSVTQRAAISLYGVSFYLWKTLVPLSLSPLYDIPSPLILSMPTLVASITAALLLMALFAVLYRRWPAGSTAFGIYLALMAPTSGIILVGSVMAADRFSYFSCVSWAILLGSVPLWSRKRTAAVVILAGLLMVLGGLTWKQTLIWKDSHALWAHTIKLQPNSATAHNQMGRVFQDEKQLDLAEFHFKRALELVPSYALAHNNLGVVLIGEGKNQEAANEFLSALESDPRNTQAAINMGNTLLNLGKLTEALQYFHQAYTINPNVYTGPMAYQLGLLCMKNHDMDQAIVYFETAVRSMPENTPGLLADAENNWGVALSSQKRFAEAIPHFERAVQFNPQSNFAKDNLRIAQRMVSAHP